MNMNDINLNLYRVFYYVANSKTFREASEKLHVSQPAVSTQIQNLEECIGTKLFYRDPLGLSLTKAGKELYVFVEKSYNYLMAGEKVVRQCQSMEEGTIVIGAPAHIASFYLLRYVEEFRKEFPNILIRIINGSTSELIGGLQHHNIDFVIDSSPIKSNSNDIKIDPLLSFETCFIMSKDADERKQKIEDMNFVMPYERSTMRRNLEKRLNECDVKIPVILEVETTDLIIQSVMKGIGSGYVVKEAVQYELQTGELIELKTDYELPKLDLNLVYITDYLTPLAKQFIKNYIKK